MDEVELNEAILALVDALARIAPEENWRSVTDLAYYGEEGEAMDVLVATVVRGNVPVTPALHQKLSVIISDFAVTPGLIATYAYAADLEMLDRMTVVDEAPS